jgi:hypothetical protein
MNDYEDILDFCSINTRTKNENQENLLDFCSINSQTTFNDIINNETDNINSTAQTDAFNYNLLNNWKKTTNIINLLSSLHSVLDNSKWKKIGIYELMDNKQIKIQYMKAMKIVHPDKCCDLDGSSKQYYNEIYDVLYASYHKHIQ